MRIAYRKVLRDLRRNKGRTIMVVLSIAVGVLALGMITSSNRLIIRQMTVAQQASQPSHAWLYLDGSVDEETLQGIERIPGVQAADGFIEAGIRWKATLESEWQDASLKALDDYEVQRFDLLSLRSGRWPDSEHVAVEFNHAAPYAVPPVGEAIYFEVNERARPITVGGTLRDPSQFPPPFSEAPTFYVTPSVMERLVEARDFNLLRFSVPEYSEEQVEAVADLIEDQLKKQDITIGIVQVQNPDRHFLQDIMDGVGLVLVVMAIASLFLSMFLVINTMNAIIAQQVPQIGIMKTVGGIRRQIGALYLAGVVVYGLLSLALAVPLGALGGDVLSRWLLSLLNVPAAPFELLRSLLLGQIGAGLLAPVLAATWPVLQGIAISVREAISVYGLGTGHYGAGWLDRLLGGIRGMPRMASLALRNTFRRAGRVALTELTLIAAGAIFMMVLTTHNSFNYTIESIFRGFGFDVLIGFEQFQRIDEIVPLIEGRPNVERAEMWVWQTASANVPGAIGPGSEYQIFLRGIPRDTELLTPELTAGRNLDPKDGHAMLLNQKLAREMGLGVGDQIVLDLDSAGASIWTIVGLIFDLGGQDQDTAYLHLDTLNDELHKSGRATVAEIRGVSETIEVQQAIEVDLRDFFESKGVAVAFSSTALENRQQANAQFNILTTILMVMTVLMAIVGSFGLSGTLSINVLERRREIGVMRAVGASSQDVAFIFMFEGLILGLLSWALAVPLSLLAGRPFVDAIGQAIEFPAIYTPTALPIWIWLGIVLALSLVASGLPARRATQISVRESLAYE